MEVFQTAAAQMGLLFAMIAVGAFARKRGVMNDEFDSKLSFIVLNITMPCMIVAAVLNSTSFPSLDMVLEIIEWGAITYLFVTLIAVIIGHFVSSNDRTRGTLEYLMVFSNVSVIGFPLLNVIFGPEAVVYGAIFNIPSTLATWTIGVMLLSNKKSGEVVSLKARLKKLGISLVSPCMISCVVSVFLVLFNVTDSGIVSNTFTTIGQFTLPGAMFVLGSSIAKNPLKDAFVNWRAMIASACRLLVMPLACYFVFGFFLNDPLLLGTIVLITAMPAASSGTMMCIDADGDVESMSQGTFLTTFMSMGTIPAMAMLLA